MTARSPVEEAKALLAKATPGPWEAKQMSESGHRTEWWARVYLGDNHYIDVETSRDIEDARLVAAAPRLLAALVEEVERLRSERADVEADRLAEQRYRADAEGARLAVAAAVAAERERATKVVTAMLEDESERDGLDLFTALEIIEERIRKGAP